MSIKEMDASQTSSCENNLKQVLNSNGCESTKFRNESHSVRILEDLQSLRQNEVLCDTRFEADDGKIIIGHKIVLIAASPYFRAMFSNFNENNEDLNNIRELDSTDSSILQLLVDYIYTGEIMVTSENVQALLQAANVLQLDYVNGVCAEFLQKQLDPSNCLGIKALADLHNCSELLSRTESYIKQHFLEMVKGFEFLSLSFEELLKLISCNDIAVPFEENVFECVIKWVKHDLDQRKDLLSELMEHVRLPLLRPDILDNIAEESLLNNSPKCKDYVFEAIRFNLKKSFQHFTIPTTIRCKPRQFGGSQKVILLFNKSDTLPECLTQWYDPTTKLQKNGPEMNDCRQISGLGVIRDQFVFALGGVNMSSSKSVSMLDVSSQSPSWVPMVDMLIRRERLGVGVLDDRIYAVGGRDGTSGLNSVEVFDVSTQKWRMVTSMSSNKWDLGVGVLNNRLYAIGGGDKNVTKSVEYYDPTLDSWTPVSNMSTKRQGVGVGVLDGVLYAIGGFTGSANLKSVEAYRPSVGVWSPIADMHMGRKNPGVVALDGLLYVFGGERESILHTVEMYDPRSNTWTMETLSENGGKLYGAVVVDRPTHCN